MIDKLMMFCDTLSVSQMTHQLDSYNSGKTHIISITTKKFKKKRINISFSEECNSKNRNMLYIRQKYFSKKNLFLSRMF